MHLKNQLDLIKNSAFQQDLSQTFRIHMWGGYLCNISSKFYWNDWYGSKDTAG